VPDDLMETDTFKCRHMTWHRAHKGHPDKGDGLLPVWHSRDHVNRVVWIGMRSADLACHWRPLTPEVLLG